MDTLRPKSFKVLLIGDSCLDVYHYGKCERISPEAPVPVFKELNQEIRLGMSHNVKLNLRSFGIEVEHITNEESIKKHRFIENRYRQQVFRFDEGETAQTSPMAPRVFGHFDAVVISDYNKGFITSTSFSLLKEQLDPTTPIFVDSKKKDLRIFGDCILKINDAEALTAIISSTQEVVITVGARGALWKGQIYETDKVDVFDVCGAGDVFLASLVYGYLSYKDLSRAIAIANRCASLSVSKMGTYVLTKEDINDLCV